MHKLICAASALLLTVACAHAPTSGIGAAMHAEDGIQVGWREDTGTDGSYTYVVRSSGRSAFDAMLAVAETRAAARCADGYRVLSLNGGDQPQVDSINPRFVLSSEVRLMVRCYEKEDDSN